MLTEAGLPMQAINGTEPLRTAKDWDYGPPTYLTPVQVVTVAEHTTALPIDDLIHATGP